MSGGDDMSMGVVAVHYGRDDDELRRMILLLRVTMAPAGVESTPSAADHADPVTAVTGTLRRRRS